MTPPPDTVDETFKAELTWEQKAAINPLFAVMSSPEHENKSADPSEWSEETVRDFYKKGVDLYVINLKPIVARLGLSKRRGFIVEYGSGMGRILKAVAANGYRCAGIDISPTMLALSRRLVPEVNELYTLKDDLTSGAPASAANVVFSYAVLQHIKALSGVRAALAEMARVCRPGGRLRFQIHSLERPFGDPTGEAPIAVFNDEHETILVYRGGGPGSTTVKVAQHSNWNGAPLAIGTVRAMLEDLGLQLTGVSQDLKATSAFWIDARKPL